MVKQSGYLALAALGLLLGGVASLAQQAPQKETVPVLKKETSLVLVDVVLTDKSGKPVRGLKREDFEIKEEGKKQAIEVFASSGESESRAAPPPLPPNVYTNRPEYHPPREPLTIVLLDSLNTPRADQMRMREEIVHYLSNSVKTKQWTALLGLSSQLYVLQDFTTDRRLLIAAAKKFAPQQSTAEGIRQQTTSRETRDEIEVLMQEVQNGMPGGMETVWLMERFLDDVTNVADKDRAGRTLAALHTLANAVVGYPGRKNLIWVSAAFPVYFAPTYRKGSDTSNTRLAGSMLGQSVEDKVRDTFRLLNDARVAIYPVDPRGLINPTEPESFAEFASRQAQQVQQNAPQDTPRNPINYLRISQGTLNELAEGTGGQAFFNRNDIQQAVALAVTDGSSYYTLGYYPDNKNWDGRYRNIELKLARKGAQLRYRKGYFATRVTFHDAQADATSPSVTPDLEAALSDPFPATGIVFRAKLAPPAPASAAQVRVEFWLDKDSFPVQGWSEGARQINMDYVVAAYSAEGKMAASAAKRVAWSLKPNDYAQVLQRGLLLPVTVELPPGEYTMRLLLRDRQSGQMGRVDLPLTVPAPPPAASP
ncbi:MAG TPA: VWA domain-containing protein [Candidatus Acidoferrales bacterium]|nr:VWA domain-containing protein [Candidatus Acidoferrales bacterium]